MLSIIICSKEPKLSHAFKQHIESTVGVIHECIFIDNSTNCHSILSAYNEGIKKSQYPNLCFVHEDVEFQTQNWGEKLCKHLSSSTVGMVGIGGSSYQSRVPASWSLYNHTLYIVQSDKKRKLRIFEQSDGYSDIHQKQVVAMDGVFLAARRDLFNQIAFDEQTFRGFHAYDLDICLQSHVLGYKNMAINDILLIHFSRGYLNKKWMHNLLLFTDKWHQHLPINVGGHSSEDTLQCEIRYMKRIFLKYLVRFGYSDQDCKHLLIKYLSNSPSFVEWVRSTEFNRHLFKLRLKKKPFSLLILPVSKIEKADSSNL